MARTTTTGGTISKTWRAADDVGTPLETDDTGQYKLIEPDPNEFVTPPKGTRAKLRLSGITEQFMMPGYTDTEVMEPKVKIEFLIVNLKGTNIEWMAGKHFTVMFSDKVSTNSALGKLFAALSGQPIPSNTNGYPYDEYIGTEFVALIGSNDAGTYARINPDAIETAKTVLSPGAAAYFAGTSKQPALVGAAVGAVDDEPDPFAEGDL